MNIWGLQTLVKPQETEEEVWAGNGRPPHQQGSGMVVRSREVVEAEDVVSSKEVVRAHDVDSTTRRRAVVRNILDDRNPRNDSDGERSRYSTVSHSQSTTKVKTTGYRMKTIQQRRDPPRSFPSSSESVHSVPELTSNSSITSTASTREEAEHAAVVIKGVATKRGQQQQQQRKSFTNFAMAAEEKRRQQRRYATSQQTAKQLKVQTTDDISLSTPKSAFLVQVQPNRTESTSTSNTSNISGEDPYGALRTGNSSSLSQCYNTPRNLTYNLSGVLSPTPPSQPDPTPRQTAAPAPSRPPAAAKKTTAASAQMNDEISVLSMTPSHKTTTNGTPHSVVHHQPHDERSEHSPSEHKNNSSPSNRSVPDQQHSMVQEKKLNKDQEMAYYHYVTKRTVLQLVTEDLMSEKWKLVDYALYRLCEICCSDEHTPTTTTGSVAHNNDPPPSSQSLSSEPDSPAAANRIRFIKAGGHALIVGVMKKYEHVPDIQTSACRFIQHFLCRDKEGAFSELLGSVDGIDRVLAALQLYLPGAAEQASSSSRSSRDEQVHRYACGALTALVCSSAKMVQRLMKQPGNLSIFLAAMKVNSETNREAVGTCRVLHFISTLPQYCDEIAAAGGIEDIVCEMKEYPAKTDVQVCGCGALANLVAAATQPVAMVELIVNRLHGAQLIGAAMKAFPNLEKLQEKGVQAIFVFSGFASIQGALKAASGLSILGAALENFPRNKVIQEKGSAAMKHLLEQMIKPKQED